MNRNLNTPNTKKKNKITNTKHFRNHRKLHNFQRKRASLTKLLKRHKPDVVLLCETKLNNKHKIQFRDYIFIRNDRSNAKQDEGIGILIRNNMKFKTIQTDHPTNPTS